MLHLVLYEKWYWMIFHGYKKEEYRQDTPYWRKRIFTGEELKHDTIHFVNGYGADKPWMNVKLIGYKISPQYKTIILNLGDVIEHGNTYNAKQRLARRIANATTLSRR